jgi:flagellar biosynthesis GTPase FlhF
VTDIDVSRIVPVGAEARINGKIEASSIAASPAGLIKAATGSGQISLKDLALSGVSPDALEQTASAGLSLFTEKGTEGIIQQFADELAKGRLSLSNLPLEVTLINGVLQLGPAKKQVGSVAVETRGRFDMTTLLLDGRINLASRSISRDLGIAPAASIEWTGPPGNMKRSIDLTQLTAAITDKAIAIEQEKAAAFERDLRERAFFNRRYKAGLWQDALEAERAARKAAEEARLRAEEEERLAEEQKQREAEEKQRAEAERLRLEAERVALEAAAAQQAAASRAELQRERRRALAIVSTGRRNELAERRAAGRQSTAAKKKAQAQELDTAPLSLIPEAGAPLSIQP